MTDLTFFAWGDPHFGYETKFACDDLRASIIKQMNDLEGWPLPVEIGGCVAGPDFVVLCGDAVDGNPAEEQLEFDYYRYFMGKLKYQHYEVFGNHDGTKPYHDYFVQRYGGKSYSFEQKGIHFVALNSDYDQAEQGAVNQNDLAWLQADLGTVADEMPVVLFLHTRIDSLKNPDEVLRILADKRVILVVSAHIHIPEVFELNGISCISMGHCRNHPIDPEYGRHFYVVRIRDGRITALPWRWDLKDWERGQRWSQWCSPGADVRRFLLDKEFQVAQP